MHFVFRILKNIIYGEGKEVDTDSVYDRSENHSTDEIWNILNIMLRQCTIHNTL